MTKTTAALKLAEEALNAMLTHMGMDEDEWTKPTFNQAREALAAILEALADHSGDANEMVMDWSKVKPEAINSDPMYQMGYAAAKAEPVKQEPVALGNMKHVWDAALADAIAHSGNANETVVEPVKQEPVAWVSEDVCERQYIDGRARKIWWECKEGVGMAIYAAPVKREWVDLTDDELKAALEVHQVGLSVRIGRIAITAFKEKNK